MQKVKIYKQRRYNTDIHVMEFMPNANLSLMPSVGNPSIRQRLTDIVHNWFNNNGWKKIGGINLSFFGFDSAKPYGLYYTDGGFLHQGADLGDAFMELIYMGHKLIIEDIDTKTFKQKYEGKASWAVSLGFTLVVDGKIDIRKANKFDHATSSHPRTMIGQKKTGEILLVVNDGRNANNKGLTANEMAQVMLDLGCETAISCDGGGSSTMEVEGKIINTPSDGSQRAIANGLLLYAKGGYQIEYVGDKVNKKVQVTTSWLNIRDGANMTSTNIIGRYSANEIVDVYEVIGEWYKTDKGYIYAPYTKDYIEAPKQEVKIVNGVRYVIDHIPKDQCTWNEVVNGKTVTLTRRPAYPLNAEFLTVHSTGNEKSTARNERNWLTNPSNKNQDGYHIVVDDKEAIECIPLNENAWNAGDGVNGTGNRKTISIEICESGDRQKTLQNAVAVIAYLLEERKWDMSKIKRHSDWNKNSVCPSILPLGNLWQSFLNDIRNYKYQGFIKWFNDYFKPSKQVNIDDVKRLNDELKKYI